MKDGNERAARSYLTEQTLLGSLKDLAARYATRPGGYTRVLKAGYRRGDRAAMAYIEFVDNTLPPLRSDAPGPVFSDAELGAWGPPRRAGLLRSPPPPCSRAAGSRPGRQD
jgi:hypothetical protein